MKRLAASTVVVLLLACCAARAQEVPKGVNYKRAPEEVNALAQSGMESALAVSDKVPAGFFGEVTVVGPTLWRALKPSADRVLLDTKSVIMMIQVPEPIQTEGRRLLTEGERESFWRVFRSKYAKLKDGKVRKANSEEIAYYWATIPFDIEEPFLVIDTGAERFIANFTLKDGKPRLFWIDLVGDLRNLKP
jgi:hypothetical protein